MPLHDTDHGLVSLRRHSVGWPELGICERSRDAGSVPALLGVNWHGKLGSQQLDIDVSYAL